MAISTKIKIKHHKRMTLRKKLIILKNLINSKSENNSEIIMDAFMYISALTFKLEALKRERSNQLINIANYHQPSLKVNVQKLGEKKTRLTITIEKAKDNYLGRILEAFEEMGVDVIHARVSCNTQFVMESIVEVNHTSNYNYGQEIDESFLSEVILKAIGGCNNTN